VKFERLRGGVVENRSIDCYNRLFDEPFRRVEDPSPWGLSVPENYRKKLKKHIYMLNKLIPEHIGSFCDISAGSGRFSWEIAVKSKTAVLCDISVDSVCYLTKKSIEKKRTNIFIARCDYLKPPFKKDIFDVVLCNDTLISGRDHEKKLLAAIYDVLRPGGSAILDFAYLYHRGFWHLPHSVAYSRREMIDMLEETGFRVDKYLPLYHELSNDPEEKRVTSKLLKCILPPTRYIFRVFK
ncbi:MAG: class I SAM-dependent methyltransferase, partial [Candidatus Omnitrophica bacterium]|nr:class I SAM-dependent methyltransferase [Candidatus Omnitrophota bacterium]